MSKIKGCKLTRILSNNNYYHNLIEFKIIDEYIFRGFKCYKSKCESVEWIYSYDCDKIFARCKRHRIE